MRLFQIEVVNNQLRVMMNTAKLNLTPDQLLQMGQAVRASGVRVQARAVRNVSGYPVIYDGQVFRVVVRTGALKGAIDLEYPYQGPLAVRVYVNGTHTAQPMQIGDVVIKPRPVRTYAAAIEFGHESIDLKKTMMGKTVPFFASRSKSSTGPYSVRGLTPAGDSGLWENKPLNARLQAGGKGPMHFQRRATKAAYEGASKGGGAYYIAFRKVGKTGWVIPAARQRPFMRAALRQSERSTREIIGAQLRTVLSDDGTNH